MAVSILQCSDVVRARVGRQPTLRLARGLGTVCFRITWMCRKYLSSQSEPTVEEADNLQDVLCRLAARADKGPISRRQAVQAVSWEGAQ